MKPTPTLTLISKKTTLLFAFFCLTVSAYTQTYTSIADGNWTDVSGTWSTDGGTTDCFCNPPLFTLALNVDINILHDINMDSPINLGPLTSLTVSTTGRLTNITKKLIVKGTATFNGFVHIKSFEARVGANVNLNQIIFKTLNQINIGGIISLDGSILEIEDGNFYVIAPNGELHLNGGSKLKISGNFNNANYTFICSTCCIESSTGNIQNTSTGTIDGDGALLSDVGNIINDNIIDPNMNWCVAGNSFGMTNSENCTGTNNICSVSPLSLNQNRVFAQNEKNEHIILSWKNTALENDFTYEIYRSENNVDWLSIMSKSSNLESANYTYFDSNIYEGIYYYKIKFTRNNDVTYSNTVSVNVFNNDMFNLYPNPVKTNKYITLNSKERTNANVTVYNHIGQIVFAEELNLEKGGNKLMLNNLKPAFYNIVVDAENAIHNQRLIITD